MYDVIVVGARVAGASTALLMARQGYRVLLVDRARFPSDKLSTMYTHQTGIARLARMGVLDAVKATGAPALDRAVYEVGDARLVGCSLPCEGQRAAYAPRRYLVDKILIDAAVAAGAEFREASSVTGPYWDGDRVAGVEFRGSRDQRNYERARLTVGADGMRSVLAKGIGADYVVRDPLSTCIYYNFWQDLNADFELYERPGRWIGTVPTNDNMTLIASYYPQADFDRVRKDPMAFYLDNIRTTAPGLYERAMECEQAERLRGTGDQQNFFRQPSGPGWALVGDAVHHKDSITARGISDALFATELLAKTVGDALESPARLDAALERYADDLLDSLFEGYRNTLHTSMLRIDPDRLQMLRVVSQSQTLTDRYFSTAAGVLSGEEFYDEELHRILAA